MNQLIRGQKIKLADVLDISQPLFIRLQLEGLNYDAASFGLDSAYRLSNEAYMTFYNQPKTPCGAVELQATDSTNPQFKFQLGQLNSQINHLVLTVAVDGAGVMSQLKQGVAQLLDAQQQVLAEFRIDGSLFQQERAIMLVELYRKEGIWRLAAVAQGFNEGLDALIRHFGGEVAEEQPGQATIPAAPVPPASSPAPAAVSKIDLKKKLSLEKAAKTGNPSIIDLTKKSLVQLEKRNLLDVQARVALVLDASGSMDLQYRRGDVQKVVDRLMPLAINFDNDGSFECWAFAQKTTQLDDVQLDNVNDFISTTQRGWRNWTVGARYNEEIPAIQAVIDFYKRFKDNLPVYVLFISDGGVGNARDMKRILSDAAKLPIFWQFVGIGGRNYGVLEKLDDLEGRVVDNCNFFEMDNITSLSDERLYELLLEEFPDWLKAARQKGIVA